MIAQPQKSKPRAPTKRVKTIKRVQKTKRAPPAAPTPRHDVILAIRDIHMQRIITGEKTYEFRPYLLPRTVQRVWFYRTSPHQSIEYVCEIDPARTRNPGDPVLEEKGIGNHEFNSRHKDMVGSDYAYKILSVYQLETPIDLAQMKKEHGIKGVPQSRVYTPQSMLTINWRGSKKLR
jgi:predicted transcriptional regulator